MFKVMQLNGSQEEVHLACITLKSMLFAYMILSSQVTVVVIFNSLECWNFDEVVNYINAFEKLKKNPTQKPFCIKRQGVHRVPKALWGTRLRAPKM